MGYPIGPSEQRCNPKPRKSNHFYHLHVNVNTVSQQSEKIRCCQSYVIWYYSSNLGHSFWEANVHHRRETVKWCALWLLNICTRKNLESKETKWLIGLSGLRVGFVGWVGRVVLRCSKEMLTAYILLFEACHS